MFQAYLSIFNTFYQNAVKNHRYSDLLASTMERFLIFQTQQIDRQLKDKQCGSEKPSSFQSMGSDHSGKAKQLKLIKKLFFSNQYETVLLFYAFFKMLTEEKATNIHQILLNIKPKLRIIKETQLKNKYEAKLSKFMNTLSFLKERSEAEASIQWLFLELFKQFQGDSLLTAQLLSASKDRLPTRQEMKDEGYSELLKQLDVTCYIFDYIGKTIRSQGKGRIKLYLGCRNQSYFILTEEEFIKYERVYQKKSVREQKLDLFGSEKGEEQEECQIENKSQVLNEFQKLKQLYEENTKTIASLFDFKDSQDILGNGSQNKI